jgi:hypothetical protein
MIAMSDSYESSEIMEKYIYAEIEKTNFNIKIIVIVSSIVGLTNMYINYCNVEKIKQLEEKMEACENVLKYNNEINKLNTISNNNFIEQLKNDITISNDTQQKFNETLFDLEGLIQNLKKEVISTSALVNTFHPINDLKQHKEPTIYEDDELMNECYDLIPLNNIKKSTGLSWLFK